MIRRGPSSKTPGPPMPLRRSSPDRDHDVVVLYPASQRTPEHESVIHQDIALRLADLMDIPFGGTFDKRRHTQRCYFVPTDTLIGHDLKERLGIRGEMDLFGGYADHAFMPTKAITHGVPGPQSQRPPGWSEEFSRHIAESTLPGYTAFSLDDARSAGDLLFATHGAFRLKPVDTTAGRGQKVIADMKALEGALAELDTDALATGGVVLEAQLDSVSTYSIGQVRLPGLTVSYVGTQRLTLDNHGQQVYGGSRLQFARGGFNALQGLGLSDECRRAVELARVYDDAAGNCYPGFFASRRNYDVAAGTDTRGTHRMGVLEQSWRIGGASRAEIAAIEVLAANPDCPGLWAETLELFGEHEDAPAHAVETFAGKDPHLGLIRKYVMVQANGNQQQHS